MCQPRLSGWSLHDLDVIMGSNISTLGEGAGVGQLQRSVPLIILSKQMQNLDYRWRRCAMGEDQAPLGSYLLQETVTA